MVEQRKKKPTKVNYPKTVTIQLDKDGSIKVDTGETTVIEFLGMLESAKILVTAPKGDK